MLKIHALNRESSSDEEVPIIRREAQEEIVLELYNNALRLQNSGQLSEAEDVLLNLLNNNIPQLENDGGLPASMSTLKYSCYVNIGNIYIKDEKPEEALDCYLNASKLDGTDVTLWYKVGKLAIKQNRFRQAAYAFSKGLECSESHWPCLDQLISLLYAMKETISCLIFIGKALILDEDYIKGLVLRKQIYQDNPATIVYYQKYNPNNVWEPPLDIQIDDAEAALVLEKEQILCDQITAVEKSLGLKTLDTIPLPKALDEFTWVSLGKVVTELHRYLTNNNMSHFTMVDIDKCMNESTPDVVMEEPLVNQEPEQINEQIEEATIIEKNIELEMEEEREKIEMELVSERRPSQNSETNIEGQENTPIQTDNDEPMEQDVEDGEENSESKSEKSRSLNKSSKRKRDLLSDLQIWGWHSKRKGAKKGKTDKDLTVDDAFKRIIPRHLLTNQTSEEKSNQDFNIDMYDIPPEQTSIMHSPKTEQYFNTNREKEDVLSLWTQTRKCCDAIILIQDFVLAVSKLWNFKWPKELVSLYIEAYEMFREHCEHPPVLSGEASFTELRDDALSTLLYGEFLNFTHLKTDSKMLPIMSLGFLQLISGWKDWEEEFVPMFCRIYWLRSHIFRKEGDNELAINSLELIKEVIENEEKKHENIYCLSLPNCYNCGFISLDIVSKILKHLDMITSLNCIEDLYNKEEYREVADIIKLTFSISENHPTCGRMGRPAQLAMLMHSLWYIDLHESFVWTEECLFEAVPYFLKPSKDYSKWEKIVDKCLAFCQEIIRMETVAVVDSLSEEKQARLVESITKIIFKQLSLKNPTRLFVSVVSPWILLHYILVRVEHRQQANRRVSHVKNRDKTIVDDFVEEHDDLPSSIAILFSAHDFLGPKGICLTNNGELLHFILDTILDRLDTPIFESLREKIDIHIEQALFCLYQHPSKKNKISRHLADHNVDPLSLTWERAFHLYDFYGPDSIPEFNSYKNASISSDTEQLLQRIIALVPNAMDPQPHMTKITDFIQGKTTELPESIEFTAKVRAIYYLIGDYYFKQREFTRCIKYFMLDLCINSFRLDSWACIGLSYISQLENKLNFCKKLKNEMEFLDKAKAAQISLKKALDLEKDHIVLWIEYGSFEYMVHSFCSRVMKSESDTLSMERFEYLENQKNSYLESSGKSFERAIQLYQPDDSDADERWLQYYILGKVAEKKQQEPHEYLRHYATAGKLLHENNATYPEKINYHNPQHLSVEALEMHYRLNASILKYLEFHESKEIPNSIGNVFKEYLEKSYFSKLSIGKQTTTCLTKPTISEKSKDDQIRKDVDTCIHDLVTKVERALLEELSIKAKSDKEESELSDVVMISDSDDEQMNKVVNESEDKKNVQEFLDKMMEETMKKHDDQELDSDTSVASKNVIEAKMEENKEKVDKLKSESETETDIRTSVDDSTSSTSSSSSSSSSSDSDSDDDSSSSSSSSSSETTNGNMSNNEISALVDRCIIGLEQCLIRLPNYKAIYRLAHIFFNYKGKKDLSKCKQLLLGEYTCKGGCVVTGLFSERKNQNFFHGIWRIPSSEIDRPGSLSAHMSRCITLLLQILRATNDHKLLLDLSMQFRRTPDPDKIYIKDSERIQFADQAMAMCIQCLRSQMQNLSTMNENTTHRLLQDTFRSYQRVQKHEPSKEAIFSSMLTEVYKKIKQDKLPENANILELATKFCQQTRFVEKQKRQMIQTQQQTATLRSPGVTTPPVLPTPSSITYNNQPLLKRPGSGRPRGRPPLPKVPGQVRQPRGRSPNVSSGNYNWQKALIEQNATYNTYNYLKAYQDELIKQYSQSLNIAQLTQLSQYFSQATAFAQSQILASQNPLLSAQNVLKQPFVSPATDSNKVNAYKKQQDQMTAVMEAMKKYTLPGKTANVKKSSAAITQPSVTSHTKTPKLSAVVSSSSISSFPAPKIPKDTTLTHLAASLNQVTSPKSKSIYTPVTYKNTFMGAMSHPAIETKLCSGTSSTKTTSNSQVFKEPSLAKHPTLLQKNVDQAATILMKERPNISITPVLPTPGSLTTTTSFTPALSTTGKTLQEKLADKQKQLSSKQLGRNIEAEIVTAPVKKTLNIPSIPSSLSVSKATPSAMALPKFTIESGISISQIPVSTPYKAGNEVIDLHQRKSSHKSPKKDTHFPISLNVPKKPERKESSDDDVILIE